VKLVFAGDGPYRAKLQADCPEAIFMGMCSHAELAHIYASADLFLFPSLTETFGNVTLEAMASGTPVLTLPGNLVSVKATSVTVAYNNTGADVDTTIAIGTVTAPVI
jgi:glycosyltransferase involved in cell wall biosynthesis